MSSAHSVNARKNVHAQMPYSFQAFAHESSMVRGRERRNKWRDSKDKGHLAVGKISYFNLPPFLSSLIPRSLQHRSSLDFPHSPKRKNPRHLRPLPKSLALRFECPSSLLQNHTVQCSGSAEGSRAPHPTFLNLSYPSPIYACPIPLTDGTGIKAYSTPVVHLCYSLLVHPINCE